MGIFATQAIEMSAPNWDSIRVQSAPNLALLPTHIESPSQKRFTRDRIPVAAFVRVPPFWTADWAIAPGDFFDTFLLAPKACFKLFNYLGTGEGQFVFY